MWPLNANLDMTGFRPVNHAGQAPDMFGLIRCQMAQVLPQFEVNRTQYCRSWRKSRPNLAMIRRILPPRNMPTGGETGDVKYS